MRSAQILDMRSRSLLSIPRVLVAGLCRAIDMAAAPTLTTTLFLLLVLLIFDVFVIFVVFLLFIRFLIAVLLLLCKQRVALPIHWKV